MELDQKLIAVTAGAVVLALFTFIQHMAFRSPYWHARELVRRAIGILTTLGAAFVFYILWAGGDMETFIVIAGYFVIAGVVKVGHEWVDRTRHAAVMGRIDDEQTAD